MTCNAGLKNNQHKRSGKLIFCIAALLILLSACTGNGSGDEKKIVARINTYELSLAEYKKRLLREMEYDKDYKATDEGRRIFLDSLIKKEVLIQEAVRLGLDKDEAFVRAIEKYWEATLIKLLMETKAIQISALASVPEKEIQAHYEKLKKENRQLPPFQEIRADIARVLEQEKQSRMIEEWITQLEKSANIQVNTHYLNY